MRAIVAIAGVAALAAGVASRTQADTGDGQDRPWDASVRLQTTWAPDLGDGKTQKLLVYLDPSFEIDLPRQISLTAIGRLYTDIVDGLDRGHFSSRSFSAATRPVAIGDRTELYLRELYLDAPLGPVLFRLGKQQLVWGQADGIRVLDQVNPVDFREFLLEDYADARIPVWMFNAELPIGPAALQLLWIPDSTYHLIPGIDSLDPPEPFAPTSSTFRPQIPESASGFTSVDLQSARRPTWDPDEWDAGAQLSTTWKGWDFTLNYLYQTDDFPVLAYGSAEFVFEDAQLVLKVEARPVYRRHHLAGGSFSRAFGDFTVRGELVYAFHQAETTQFNIRRVPTDQLLRSDEIFYVAGVDWYGIAGLLLSAQLFQKFVLEHESPMIKPARETIVTLIAQHRSFQDRLTLRAMWFAGARLGDGLARASARWRWNDHLSTWIGVDVFYGDSNGTFGQFDRTNRAVLGFEVVF